MTIVLSPELQRLVEEKVKVGLYPSDDEMVRAGIVRLLQDEHAFEPGELQRLVRVGQDELRRGEGVDARQPPLTACAAAVRKRDAGVASERGSLNSGHLIP